MLTAWLITLGVPTGGATLAALAVWWLARRALKRRPSRAEPRPTAERLADAVVVQTQPPPAPQRVVRTTEYVQVRVPTPREKALDEAFTLYVRNYPGGVAAVETIREYARQIESGLTQKET